MKIKTNQLTGAALEWAVAQCEGIEVEIHDAAMITARRLRSLTAEEVEALAPPVPYLVVPGVSNACFSTSWALAGPIIEREHITLRPAYQGGRSESGQDVYAHDGWSAHGKPWAFWITPRPSHGPTPLIAAMRCYVASKLGDEIDIPNALLQS